jgi:outer membrane biosynthesis protein TonB
MFDIRPTDPNSKTKGGVFGKGRILLGRSESCELFVNNDSVSAVHAVLEIFDDRAVLYDMNSTNGTYVNDDKIIVKEIHAGDFFRLAEIEFEFQAYSPTTSLPPVLESLEPQRGEASVKIPSSLSGGEKTVGTLPVQAPGAAQPSVPSIVYPLAADPKAEFSEYIFEDKDQLFPIFKYEASKQAVEVIILHNDQIFSVDYLPEGKSTYYITGLMASGKAELEFPYLGKNEKIPFVDVNGTFATVHTLPGFSIFHLSDKKKDTGHHVAMSVELYGQDIVRLSKDHLQIYVRNVSAPPKVAAAPILRRDPDFQKYLFLFLFFVGMISVGMNMVEMPEDEKKDELAPERLATILYRQKLTATTSKAVEATETAPKRPQKAPEKVAVKKEIPKEQQPKVEKPDVITTKDQSKKTDPGEKTAPEKKVVKQGTQKPVPSHKIATNLPSAANKTNMPKAQSATALSSFESKSIGHVEVYKSADFSSSVSTIVAKGGSLSGIKTHSPSGAGGQLQGASTGVSTGTGNIKTADIATNQGSLVGATTGVLGSSKGAEGLSAKKAIFTAGFPSETVVLGSMDPDVIRRILIEHLPQFRYCYQKELERGANASGMIPLDFTIGASGHVTQAGIAGSSSLPTEVKGCVISVLRGIVFPAPMGGGKVEVKQPMNFQPKQL